MITKTEVFKQRQRMCESKRCCKECRLGRDHNGTECICASFLAEFPEEAVEIVSKWVKEHPEPPKRTYADVFFEKFPKAERRKQPKAKLPSTCRQPIFGESHCCTLHGGDCEPCWLEEYKEDEENE